MSALRDMARPMATAEVSPPKGGNELTTSAPDAPFGARWAGVMAVIDLLNTERARIRSVLTEVMHWTTAEDEIAATLHPLKGAAAEMERSSPRAVSEASIFMASNSPWYGDALYCVIPALYTGQVRFRPSQKVAHVAGALHRELAGHHRLRIEECDVSQRSFLRGPVKKSELVVFTGAYENAERIRG